MLSAEEYQYLYGKLNMNKIPQNISEKINNGEAFTDDEEKIIRCIICEDKKAI